MPRRNWRNWSKKASQDFLTGTSNSSLSDKIQNKSEIVLVLPISIFTALEMNFWSWRVLLIRICPIIYCPNIKIRWSFVSSPTWTNAGSPSLSGSVSPPTKRRKTKSLKSGPLALRSNRTASSPKPSQAPSPTLTPPDEGLPSRSWKDFILICSC